MPCSFQGILAELPQNTWNTALFLWLLNPGVFQTENNHDPGEMIKQLEWGMQSFVQKEIKHIQTSRTSTNNQASNSFQKQSKESKNNIQSLIPGDSWMFIPTLWYSIGNFIHPHPTWDYHHFTSCRRHAHLLATSSKASRKASLVSFATGSTKKKGITWRRAVEVVNRSNHVFVHQENSWGSPIRKVMKV
jgi:hypothetical protein